MNEFGLKFTKQECGLSVGDGDQHKYRNGNF